jgi:hypothetical protein
MDAEALIVQNLFGPLGMNHVRNIGDLYNIRQDTLEKRLEAARGLPPISLASIYAAWLQHRTLDKKQNIERKHAVHMFCATLCRLKCSKDTLRGVWRDCVARAMANASAAERGRIRGISDSVDTGIQGWFKDRGSKRRDTSLRPSASASGRGFQRLRPTHRSSIPSARRDSQRWSKSPQAPDNLDSKYGKT